MKKTFVSDRFLLWIAGFIFFSCKEMWPYLKTKLSFEERADDLLSRLTIEKKVGLMRYDSPAIDRLSIPSYNWWNECLHGVGRSSLATVFPQAIGMAVMWNSQQMFDIATIISDEACAKHHNYIAKGKRGIYQGLTFWTPNINIFRNLRWGRGWKPAGEKSLCHPLQANMSLEAKLSPDTNCRWTVRLLHKAEASITPEKVMSMYGLKPENRMK